MKRAPEAPLTPEQLQLAWRQMRRPASWPGTLDEALDNPARAACIRGYARQLARELGRPLFAAHAGPAHSLPRPPAPPTPTAPPQRSRPAFDARRAAANDFDD